MHTKTRDEALAEHLNEEHQQSLFKLPRQGLTSLKMGYLSKNK